MGHIPDEIIADTENAVLKEIFNRIGKVDFVATRGKVTETETDGDGHGHSRMAPVGGNKPQKSWAFVVFKREEDQAELVASVSNGKKVCVPADQLRESSNAAELDVQPLNEKLVDTRKYLSLLSQLRHANGLQPRWTQMDAMDDRIKQLKLHNQQPLAEKKHKRFRSATEDFISATAQEQVSWQTKGRFEKLWPEDERFDDLQNIIYRVFDDVEPTADPRADPSHLNVKSQTRWLCQHSLFMTKHQDAALIKTQEALIKTQELEAKILKLEDNMSEELKKMDAKLDRNFEAMLAAIAQQGQPAIPPPN